MDLAFRWFLPSADLGSGCHAAPLRGVPPKSRNAAARSPPVRSRSSPRPLGNRTETVSQSRLTSISIQQDQGLRLIHSRARRARFENPFLAQLPALARREPRSLEAAGTRCLWVSRESDWGGSRVEPRSPNPQRVKISLEASVFPEPHVGFRARFCYIDDSWPRRRSSSSGSRKRAGGVCSESCWRRSFSRPPSIFGGLAGTYFAVTENGSRHQRPGKIRARHPDRDLWRQWKGPEGDRAGEADRPDVRARSPRFQEMRSSPPRTRVSSSIRGSMSRGSSGP